MSINVLPSCSVVNNVHIPIGPFNKKKKLSNVEVAKTYAIALPKGIPSAMNKNTATTPPPTALGVTQDKNSQRTIMTAHLTQAICPPVSKRIRHT